MGLQKLVAESSQLHQKATHRRDFTNQTRGWSLGNEPLHTEDGNLFPLCVLLLQNLLFLRGQREKETKGDTDNADGNADVPEKGPGNPNEPKRKSLRIREDQECAGPDHEQPSREQLVAPHGNSLTLPAGADHQEVWSRGLQSCRAQSCWQACGHAFAVE